MTDTTLIKAVRLINTPDGKCTFEYGSMANTVFIEAKGFFAQTYIEEYQKVAHPAPRRQYVVTLSGTLRFKVSNGDAFIIKPGILLIAEDTEGEGHTWELIEGERWERIYIVLADGADDHFIADN
ncbi:hypothetical protein [Flavobacterium psychrotrophum]|uniref:hypothetical protein n=1 Tax=Flavobacterium psychrotrophum TaxID=2294119 RepID=UPI000E30BB94|nr:hypothetical protein [Flavobacterium psychrotrophum]